MQFLQIDSAYFHSESKHNVKYCRPLYATPRKISLLEDRTATEFSYQYGGRELPIEKIGFLRNKFFIFYIFSFWFVIIFIFSSICFYFQL